MHPHQLHATTVACSLHAARLVLDTLVARETAQNVADQLPAASVLRSTVWGTRITTGGHGDPTVGAIATLDQPTRTTWWAELRARSDRRLGWIADRAAPGPGDLLHRIAARIPALPAGAAAVVAQHLRDEDAWLRDALALPVDEGLLLPRVECPACQERLVYRAPGDVLVCRAQACRCRGEGCGCGMSALVEGLVHVWPALM
ncbi:hypothetical protein [Phytohabitans aurantiacus]|uniref:Uncharacterized protein n=1 Tax=Phytohabitans aurantiacus TaxID=3016789 RepID=A0ABQ5QTX5_9ACTN|nr:hypothetical protein [Phytohabitans aurantiacus]GLH97366.1 hypothetical protein Pa4123_26410 [Phytohabitans aurantiacus]